MIVESIDDRSGRPAIIAECAAAPECDQCYAAVSDTLGSTTKPHTHCPQCDAAVPLSLAECPWCGEEVAR